MQEHPEIKVIRITGDTYVLNIRIPHPEIILEPVSKECKYCCVEKLLEEMVKNNSRDGYAPKCKECKNKARRRGNLTPEQQEAVRKQVRDYRKVNKNYIEQNAKSRAKHRDNVLAGKKRYREMYPERVKAQIQSWLNRNKEHMKAYFRGYNVIKRQRRASCRKLPFRLPRRINKKHRRYTDKPISIEKRINTALKTRVRKFLKSGKDTDKLLGCTWVHFKEWFEYNFLREIKDTGLEMSWENYGTVWEIDHVRACVRFDMTNRDNYKKCFHWTNLAPVSVFHNRSKGKKILLDDEEILQERLMGFEAYQNRICSEYVIQNELD